MAGEPLDIPHGMKRIYRRFARWRSAHPGVRLPIPGRLWASAAEVAREHGICSNGPGSGFGVRQAEAAGGIGKCSGEGADNAGTPQQVRHIVADVHGTGRVADDRGVGVSD